MKTATATLLALSILIGSGTRAQAAEQNIGPAIEGRLIEVELETLVDVYAGVFRELQEVRGERARLESQGDDANRQEVERTARHMERLAQMLERRRAELREEIRERAGQLERMQVGNRGPTRNPERMPVERREQTVERREQMERRGSQVNPERREQDSPRPRGNSDRDPNRADDSRERREIPVSQVPGHVLEAARKAVPGIEFSSATRIESNAGPMIELKGRNGKRVAEVTVSADGHRVEARTEERDEN